MTNHLSSTPDAAAGATPRLTSSGSSRRRTATGILSAGVLAGASLIIGPTPANAATTVSVSGGAFRVVSAANKANVITVNRQFINSDEQYYRVLDSGDSLTPGPGCRESSAAIQCQITGNLKSIKVDTGDLDDTVTIAANVGQTAHLNGGPGNDTLTGGSAIDYLHGNEGSDTFTAETAMTDSLATPATTAWLGMPDMTA
ncbi:hypothetical protein [Kocuria sp. CH-021]|uniref:hypothetical protein n=1 Tax=Kocuria sp. CH-021 TaxID=3406735 RepID=UPI003C711DF2